MGRNNHRWVSTEQAPAFLECKFCKIQHTMGKDLDRTPAGSFWYRFPGGEWIRYQQGYAPTPKCPRDQPPPVEFLESPTMEDKSRQGMLVHEATSSGRTVHIVVYVEAGTHPVKSTIMCRTQEQASELARVLREAQFVVPEKKA
jgi:hypothetical protein